MADDIEVFGVELDARMERFEKQMLQTANKTDANLNRIEKKMQITNNRLRKGLEFRGFDAGSDAAFKNVEQRMAGLRGLLMGGVATLGISLGASELIRSLKEDEEAARRLEAVLKTTGYAAALSQQDIAKWADELEKRTGRGAAEIQTVAAQLATFTSIGRNEFLKTIEVADDLAATFGGDLQSNLDAVARALDDPIKGFGNLQKRGFALADSELARVKAHLKAGESAKAQGIILENLSKQVNGAAEATNQGLTKSLNSLKKQADDTFKAFADEHGTEAAIAAMNAAAGAADWLGDNMDLVLNAAKTLAVFMGTRYVLGWVTAEKGMVRTALSATQAKGAIEALMGVMTANPITLVAVGVAALTAGVLELDRRMQAARAEAAALRNAHEGLSKATDAYAEAARAAAMATGEGAKQSKEAAARTRELAIASRDAAQAKLAEAAAIVATIQARAAEQNNFERFNIRGDRPGSFGPGSRLSREQQDRLETAQEDARLTADAIAKANASIAEADRILKGGGSTQVDFEDKPDKNTGKKAEARRRAIEDMAAEVAMQEAQLTNDQDRIKVLEREAAIRSRTRALLDAEIVKSKDAAKAEAERVQVRLDDALVQQEQRLIAEAQKSLSLDIAQTEKNHERVRQLERQAELEERIVAYNADLKDLAAATRLATLDMVELDKARADAAARRLRDAQAEHELAIAQLSGNERLTKQLQDQASIKERTERYRTEGILDPAAAEQRATQEVTRERLAATYGEHRELFATAFSDGIRAALSGDLQGFLSNQFGNFADTMFQKAGEQLYDAMFGGVSAVTEGAGQGAAISATVAPAIVGAGATAAASMGAAITAAGAAAGAAMAASITAANLSKVPFLPGFSGGGYTGPGPVNTAKGVVHAGEVVWSQRDVANAGGVGTVEAMRRGVPGYAAGGIVGRRTAVDQAYSAMGRLASARSSNQPVIVQLSVDEGGLFVPRVQALSGQVAVQTTAAGVSYAQHETQQSARRQRQRLV